MDTVSTEVTQLQAPPVTSKNNALQSIDAENIIKATAAYQNSVAAIMQGMPPAGVGMSNFIQAAATATKGSAAVIAAEAGFRAETQSRKSEAEAMYGMTPGAFSADVASALTLADKSSAEFLKRSKDIQERSSKSFLDNPVDWIVNQISLPFEIDSANKFAHTANAANDFISSRLKLTSDSAVLANISQKTTSDALTLGATQIASAKIQQDLGDALLRVKASDMQGTSIFLTASHQEYTSTINAIDAGNKKIAFDLELAKTGVDWDVKERARLEQVIDMRLKTFQTQNFEEQAKTRAIMDENFSVASAVMGTKLMTFSIWHSLPDGAVKTLWAQLAQSPEIQAGRLSSNMFNAVEFFDLLKAPGTVGSRYTADAIRNAIAKHVLANDNAYKLLDAQGKIAFMQKFTTELQATWLGDMDGATSPYRLAPLKTLLTIPAIASGRLASYLSSLVQPTDDPNGTYMVTGDDVKSAALYLMKNYNVPVEEAAKEFTTFYEAASADVSQSRALGRFALQPIIAGRSGYTVSITPTGIGASFMGKSSVDALNQSAAAAMLLRSSMARIPIPSMLERLK